MSVENFRALKELPQVEFHELPTLVGKNDSGKSSILYALNVFFGEQNLDHSDFYRQCGDDAEVVITVCLSDLPGSIQLEEEVDTTFEEEHLLTKAGELKITKRYPKKLSKLKATTTLKVFDFVDKDVPNLCSKKQAELIQIGNERFGLDLKKAGRSLTNRDKRAALREEANKCGLPKDEIEIQPSDDLIKNIERYLPNYALFKCDTKLGVEETSFQSEFRPIVEQVVDQNITTKETIQEDIKAGLARELDSILLKLQQHTDAVSKLTPIVDFQWKSFVKFNIQADDQDGIDVPMSLRGAGVRRLLMVAFFQYLVERVVGGKSQGQYIFAIEEPETFLYPRAQRDLLETFLELSRSGQQIILTTHSPVFAGSVGSQNLALIKRTGGVATVYQGDGLQMEELADELGIDPRDQIFGYKACVFVEGSTDATFLENIAKVLKANGIVSRDFGDSDIGLIPTNGSSIKFFVDRRAFKRLHKKYGVMLDSDRESPESEIAPWKLRLKAQCESEKGVVYILRKKEIENYIHPAAVKRKTGKELTIGDYDKAKDLLKREGIPISIVGGMTVGEIMEKDCYLDDEGNEWHELIEIVKAFLDMV